MKLFTILITFLLSFNSFSQGEYEAEEFVNDMDLKFAVKQMQKSEYIGTAIACEMETPEVCDSVANITFEKQKGKIKIPVASFTNIQHYTVDSTQLMSAQNPQINRLIIQVVAGEKVYAADEGEVTSIFKIPGNEMVVMIKHGSYRTVYGTLDNLEVNVGDWVKKGDILGEIADLDNGKMVFEIWKSFQNKNQSQNVEEWIELN